MKKHFDKFKLWYHGYLYFLIKYFSPKKAFNLILNFIEFRFKVVNIRSFPAIVHIDVSNMCVLNCPLCPTGKRDKRQKKAVLGFSDFKRVFDQVKEYTFFVWLYNWGEPFLCKDIFKIIRYCHQNNVGVKIDSNLNLQTESILKKIVNTQVDYLSLSIDGFTQKIINITEKAEKSKRFFLEWKKSSATKKERKAGGRLLFGNIL